MLVQVFPQSANTKLGQSAPTDISSSSRFSDSRLKLYMWSFFSSATIRFLPHLGCASAIIEVDQVCFAPSICSFAPERSPSAVSHITHAFVALVRRRASDMCAKRFRDRVSETRGKAIAKIGMVLAIPPKSQNSTAAAAV